jgi:hypothetical protein
MPNPHDHPTALKDLQDAIYRDRVIRSRALTPEQRIADIFEMAEVSIHMVHAGAMSHLGTADEDAGWQLVKVWNSRLRRAHDYRFYVNDHPKSA